MAIPLPPALGRHDRVQWFFDLRCGLKSVVQSVQYRRGKIGQAILVPNGLAFSAWTMATVRRIHQRPQSAARESRFAFNFGA